MLERLNPVLRLLCLGLAALVLWQVARFLTRPNPLAEVNTTATPAWFAAPEKPIETGPTNPLPRSGKSAAPLPPAIQARVDRITQSEILGPVIRPLPMALLGIAGKDALLRTPEGQTGLLREGEELGGVKLLRIGTNRVLIEHEQQKKELTLFSGFGSDSLLPKERPITP